MAVARETASSATEKLWVSAAIFSSRLCALAVNLAGEMFRESLQAKTARLKKFIASFQKTYPDAHCELTYANPLQLLVAVILSAQCTDKRVLHKFNLKYISR